MLTIFNLNQIFLDFITNQHAKSIKHKKNHLSVVCNLCENC